MTEWSLISLGNVKLRVRIPVWEILTPTGRQTDRQTDRQTEKERRRRRRRRRRPNCLAFSDAPE